MRSSKVADFFFGLLFVSFLVLIGYGMFLMDAASKKQRKEKHERLYKEGFAAGEIELNPLLSPYSHDNYYNSMWKRGYTDALMKKKQRAEHE